MWILLLISAKYGNFVKLNTTILKKNQEQRNYFRTKPAISPTEIVSVGILSTDTSLKKIFFVHRHTDRLFASRTNIPQAVVALYLIQ